MSDLLEQSNEIQEIMGRTYGVPDDIDEGDLEAGNASSCVCLTQHTVNTSHLCLISSCCRFSIAASCIFICIGMLLTICLELEGLDDLDLGELESDSTPAYLNAPSVPTTQPVAKQEDDIGAGYQLPDPPQSLQT